MYQAQGNVYLIEHKHNYNAFIFNCTFWRQKLQRYILSFFPSNEFGPALVQINYGQVICNSNCKHQRKACKWQNSKGNCCKNQTLLWTVPSAVAAHRRIGERYAIPPNATSRTKICGIMLQRSYHKGKPQLTDLPLSHPSQSNLSEDFFWDAFRSLGIRLNFLKALKSFWGWCLHNASPAQSISNWKICIHSIPQGWQT